MLMTVLCESPSRIVRCSKYMGRTVGTGAAASAAPLNAASAAHAARIPTKLRSHRNCMLALLLILFRRTHHRGAARHVALAPRVAFTPGVAVAPEIAVAPGVTVAPRVAFAPGMRDV